MWWIGRGPRLTEADREEVFERLFFEGDRRGPYVRRFANLMALATIIASLGLVVDSVAVVIGAMLVAPLMTPILALSASLAMAWPSRQLSAVLLVAAGCLGAIGVAWLVATLLPPQRFAELPGEVLSRTNPSLIDLGIGLAAGAAGAYATVRSKADAALPGVAVAVALVPPLATTGILLQQGEGALAGGAALLFLTNLAAIVLAAVAVFLATGFTPRARAERRRGDIRRGIAIALLAVAAVAYPLGRQSADLVERQEAQTAIGEQIESWLGGRNAELSRVQLGEDDRFDVTVDLVGRDAPPPVRPLAAAIARRLGHPIKLTVNYTPREQWTIGAGRGSRAP